jgi:hypothetical protein
MRFASKPFQIFHPHRPDEIERTGMGRADDEAPP